MLQAKKPCPENTCQAIIQATNSSGEMWEYTILGAVIAEAGWNSQAHDTWGNNSRSRIKLPSSANNGKGMEVQNSTTQLGLSAKGHISTHLRPMCGDHSEANVHNGHQDEKEIKFVPAIAPVAAPSQAGDLDASLNNEDCCEAVVAILLGIGEGCGLIVNSGSQDNDVDHNDCRDDVVEGLQTGPSSVHYSITS